MPPEATTPTGSASPTAKGALKKDMNTPPPVGMVKLAPLHPVPSEVVTQMNPVITSGGTVAVICPGPFTVKIADIPPMVTEVAPVKLAPKMLTSVPGGPLVGPKEVTTGAVPVGGGEDAVTVKLLGLKPVPVEVVMLMRPVAALAGTVAST